MTKRRTPLQVLMESVMVGSSADGTLRVTPKYRDEKPGLFTRMRAARHMERVLNAHLRRK